jgi:ferredoxin
MSVPTSRASGTAEVIIDQERCTVCGACVSVCKGGPLYIDNHRLMVDQELGFGCIACAACAAVCPTDAIRISGRDLFPDDIYPVPPASERGSYDALNALMVSRRSTRAFTQQEIEPELIERILAAASTSPVGIPPSDVSVLVFRSRASIAALRIDLMHAIRHWPKIFSPTLMKILRPFIGKVNADMFAGFIRPAVKTFLEKWAEGKDWLFYNAPLVLYFYGSAYTDPADAVVAATHAMLAGESHGLGTCMLGFPGYIIQYSGSVRKKYSLPKLNQPGLAVIFGYPKYRVRNAVKRRFKEVREVV